MVIVAQHLEEIGCRIVTRARSHGVQSGVALNQLIIVPAAHTLQRTETVVTTLFLKLVALSIALITLTSSSEDMT